MASLLESGWLVLIFLHFRFFSSFPFSAQSLSLVCLPLYLELHLKIDSGIWRPGFRVFAFSFMEAIVLVIFFKVLLEMGKEGADISRVSVYFVLVIAIRLMFMGFTF